MPTYQYACTNPGCGNEFEQFQAFTDAALSACPVCSERVRKVYGSVGVVFKGSGFYRTDSRDSKTASTASASSGSSDGASSGSSGSADSGSKPAVKSESKSGGSSSSSEGSS